MSDILERLWNTAIDASDISSDDEWIRDDIWDELYGQESENE
jgi:hypothetical protein